MPKIFKTKVEKCGEMIVLAYCQEFSREDEKIWWNIYAG